MNNKAGAIRAGRAFVALFADDSQLNAGLKRALAKLRGFGVAVQQTGQQMAMASAAAAAPLALATRASGSFEQALANMRAAANPTIEQMHALRNAALEISQATGMAPTEVVDAFNELAKAGVRVEDILGGAADAAIKFAKVGAIDAASATRTLVAAVNIFAATGISYEEAANTISSAADAATISIQNLVDAMAQGGASAGLSSQSLKEFSAAIAIMGQEGIVGSDAGTSMKTFLSRLAMGAEGTGEKLKEMGVQVYGVNGQVRPMVEIIAELERAMAGMSTEARNVKIYDLFGSDAQRAAAVLMELGSDGFGRFLQKMDNANSVGTKFSMMMDTMLGDLSKLQASLLVLAIKVGDNLLAPVRKFTVAFVGVAAAAGAWIEANGEIVKSVAKVVLVGLGVGGALIGIGLALKVAAAAGGGIVAVLSLGVTVFKAAAIAAVALVSPLGLMAAAIAGVGAILLNYTDAGAAALDWLGERFKSLSEGVSAVVNAVITALQRGDIAAAGKVLWSALKLAWTEGTTALKRMWVQFKGDFVLLFTEGLGKARLAWNNFSSTIARVWAETVATVAGVWEKTINAVSQSMVKSGMFFDRNEMKKREQEQLDAAAKFDAQAAAAQAAGDGERAKKLREDAAKARELAKAETFEAATSAAAAQLEKDSRERQKTIEQTRKAAIDGIDAEAAKAEAEIASQLQQDQDNNVASINQEMADARAELEKAREALKDAIKGAMDPNAPETQAAVGEAKKRIAAAIDNFKTQAQGGGLTNGLAARGAFSATSVAALGNVGSSEQRKANQKLTESNRNLADLNKKMDKIASRGVRVMMNYGA